MCKYCRRMDKKYFQYAEKGNMRVWWIPQLPMEAFHFPVETVDEAILLLEALAEYDLFQLEHSVKPDFSNVGGLETFDGEEWSEFYDEDGMSVDEIRDAREEEENEE